jgi:hypothetical protein
VEEEVARMMMAAAAAADAAFSLGDKLAPMCERRLQKSCARWSEVRDDVGQCEGVREGCAPAGGGRR